jgi:GTPase SAR1 family protein
MAENAIKVVLMGQGGVGKTAMTLRYTSGEFNAQVRVRKTIILLCVVVGASGTLVIGLKKTNKERGFSRRSEQISSL